MSCGGGYLGFPIGMKNINFVEDLPITLWENVQMPSSQKLQI
jgi:hypothetical protein